MTTQEWLEQRLARKARLSLFGSVVAMLAGIVVVFVTFWFVYGVIWFVFDWLLPMSHNVRLIASGGVIVLLFVGNLRAGWNYQEATPFDDFPDDFRTSCTDWPHDEGLPPSILPVVGLRLAVESPESCHSFIKILTSALYFGPRLCTQSVRLIRSASLMRSADVEACAAAIEALFRREHAIPLNEMRQAVPFCYDAVAVVRQLHSLDGIRFVDSEPPAIALSSQMREEIEQEVGTAERVRVEEREAEHAE